MIRAGLRWGLLALALAALAACAHAHAAHTATAATWPAANWRPSAPETAGVDATRLTAALRALREARLPVHQLYVVRHGRVLLDATAFPMPEGAPHRLDDATAALTALVYAAAVHQGIAPPPDTRVVDALPRLANAPTPPGVSQRDEDVAWARMTIGDVLDQRMGLALPEGTLAALADQEATPWVRRIGALAGDTLPGTEHHPFPPAPQLIAAIVADRAGRPFDDVAYDILFGPLGVDAADVSWDRLPNGDVDAFRGLSARPDAIARAAALLLTDGVWDGTRLLPTGWSAPPVGPAADTEVFQRGWWRLTDGSLEARGRGGQRVLADPTRAAVVVLTAGATPTDEPAIDAFLSERLLPPLDAHTPLPVDRRAADALAARVRGLAQPYAPTASSPRPAEARPLDGAWFALAGAPFDTLRVGAELLDPVGALRFDWAEVRVHLPFTFVDVPTVTTFPAPRGPLRAHVAAHGSWVSPGVLQVELDTLGDIQRWTITLAFAGDEVTATWTPQVLVGPLDDAAATAIGTRSR